MALGHWLKDYIGPHSGGSGGGGSLPPITADDIGTILAVVADLDNVSPKEVIPEQTITIVDTKVEVTADWGGYSPALAISAKMTFNGIEYDAIVENGYYDVAIPTDEDFMHVRVSSEDDGSSITTEEYHRFPILLPLRSVSNRNMYVNVVDDRGNAIPGNYNISLTIMAPGVKYGLIPMESI